MAQHVPMKSKAVPTIIMGAISIRAIESPEEDVVLLLRDLEVDLEDEPPEEPPDEVSVSVLPSDFKSS